MLHSAPRSSLSVICDLRKAQEIDPPSPNEDATIECRRDCCLVLLDQASILVGLLLPALLLGLPDALQLVRVGVHTLTKTIHLVRGESVVADEQVTHRDVEVTLSLRYGQVNMT